jgi:hypothetical protein
MFKSTTLMAGVAVVAIALAVPTVASAQWTDGTAPVEGNPGISFAGSFAFTGSFGGTSCQQATTAAQITGGQIFAHTNSFAVDNPTGCTGQGQLAFCQLHAVTFEQTQPSPWTMYTSAPAIEITTPTLQYHYTGAFCPILTLQLEAAGITLTFAEGEQHAIKQGQLSGTLTGTSGGKNLGNATVSGTWSVTPSGTYGLT